MKILFVSSGNSEDGISSIVKTQGKSLQNQGILLEYFPIKGKGIKGYFFNIFILRKYLKINHFDIIHAHYGWCGIVSAFARRKEKLIVSFMGDDLIGSVNKKYKYSFISVLTTYANFILSKYFCDLNIVKSRQMLERVFKKNCFVIPNGVNINMFHQININTAQKYTGLISNKKYILFAANPSRFEKNFKLAEAAINILKSKLPKIEMITLFNKSQEEINCYFNAINVVLLTSFHEGSPNIIKEAMACGCSIVSTNVGDVKWVFGKTEGCYLTEFDANDVAKKINLALNFSEEKGRTKGRERIIELGLDSETIAKKIVDIYDKALEK